MTDLAVSSIAVSRLPCKRTFEMHIFGNVLAAFNQKQHKSPWCKFYTSIAQSIMILRELSTALGNVSDSYKKPDAFWCRLLYTRIAGNKFITSKPAGRFTHCEKSHQCWFTMVRLADKWGSPGVAPGANQTLAHLESLTFVRGPFKTTTVCLSSVSIYISSIYVQN